MEIGKILKDVPAPLQSKCVAIETASNYSACLVSQTEDTLDRKSLLCLTIGVGRLHDPPDCLGLAELLAGMVAMQTDSTIGLTGSVRVADDRTEFSYKITSSDNVSKVLKQLIKSITTPEFSANRIKYLIKKEKYKQQLSSLNWLQRCSGNSNHPYNRMVQPSQRTVELFQIEELCDRLAEFHKRHFNSNCRRRMALEDGRSTDELVIRGKRMNLGGIFIVFPLPDQTDLHKKSPDLLVKYLFGRDGLGSLKEYLRTKLGVQLDSASLTDTGCIDFDTFCIALHCDETTKYTVETEDLIISAVFRYLAMIRSQAQHFEQLHNEVRLDRRAHFLPEVDDWSAFLKLKRLPLVNDEFNIATRLHRYEIADVLSARHLLSSYSAEEMNGFLACLTVDQCRVFVSDLDWHTEHVCLFSSPDGRLCCQPDGIAPYNLEKLSENLLALCRAEWPTASCQIDTVFTWPRPRPFVCKNFSLKPRDLTNQPNGPRKIKRQSTLDGSSSSTNLWFRQDDRFQTELAYISVDLLPPVDVVRLALASSLQISILANLFSEELADLKMQAVEADLELSVSRSCNGIQVCCSGHSEPLPALLLAALGRIAELRVPLNYFNQPDREVEINPSSFIAHHFSNPAHATPLERENWPSRPELYAEILALGNLTAEQVISLVDSITAVLPPLSRRPADTFRLDPFFMRCSERLLPRGSHHFIRLNFATNRSIELTSRTTRLKKGDAALTKSVCGLLLQMPTAISGGLKKQASKYDDFFFRRFWHNCCLWLLKEALTLCTKTARLYKARFKIETTIELVIACVGKTVDSITKEQLAGMKSRVQQLATRLFTAPNLNRQHELYWRHITCGDYDFSWDTIKWLKQGSQDRRVLSVHKINRQQFTFNAQDDYYATYQGIEVRSLDDFKQNLQDCIPMQTASLKDTFNS
uniref:Peptidase_M16_M domain-containing protein n=1 Tax=Macrostomum lignano TaxID=282301 RepID=A0A1I8JAY1_9PLAT